MIKYLHITNSTYTYLMNYNTLNHSIYYYQSKGYTYIDAPWLVDNDISNLTKPIENENFIVKDLVLVGSAEQSFMQLIKNNELENGKYVTLTPCFRDDELDNLHQRYFMKTELIIVDSLVNLLEEFNNIVTLCLQFFNQYVQVELLDLTGEKNCVIDNVLTPCYDIIDVKNKIELGSYGIRSMIVDDKQVCWIYATGCAEPRLSYVINLDKKVGYHNAIIQKNKVGTFEKILEEVDELKDAHLEKNKIMELVELSDLLGSIELYIKEKYNMTLNDLDIMNKTTQRAFVSGRR